MSVPTHETVTLSTLHPFLKRNSTKTPSGSTVVSYTHDTGKGPVLWLVHGYPQSAFIWRHVAPILKEQTSISLFIPELPGYGISTPAASGNKRDVGQSLLEASTTLFPGRDVILGGHDRGARICHRLAVDHAHPPNSFSLSYNLLGVIMLDIVPTRVQWEVFQNPKASAAYYHWPFLASPGAADILYAYGGDKWVLGSLERVGGFNEAALERFKSDRAWEVYTSLFKTKAALEGSSADYAAGVDPEPQEQDKDQAEGRKIECATLIMYSAARLGAMHGGKIPEIWTPWIKEGVEWKSYGCEDGVGHYLPEEATDEVAYSILDFIVFTKRWSSWTE